MVNKSYIIGNQCFFVREGDAFTLPAPGVAGRNAIPGATDTSWVNLGYIPENDFSVETKSEKREVYAATPGQIRRVDSKTTKLAHDFKFPVVDLQPLIFELIYRTAPLTANGADQAYAPLSGKEKRGWLQIQQYGEDDQLLNTINHWGNLLVDGAVKFGDDIVKPGFVFNGLYSPLNAGVLV